MLDLLDGRGTGRSESADNGFIHLQCYDLIDMEHLRHPCCKNPAVSKGQFLEVNLTWEISRNRKYRITVTLSLIVIICVIIQLLYVYCIL